MSNHGEDIADDDYDPEGSTVAETEWLIANIERLPKVDPRSKWVGEPRKQAAGAS